MGGSVMESGKPGTRNPCRTGGMKTGVSQVVLASKTKRNAVHVQPGQPAAAPSSAGGLET